MTEPKWKTKYGDSPVYYINRYILEKISAMEFIDPAQYKTDLSDQEDFQIPFMIPGQDLPEMTTVYDNDQFKDLAYCIYSVSHRSSPDEPYMFCGQVTYTFYNGDIDMLMGLADYLTELLRREDWSAGDINVFYREEAVYPWDFKWVNVLTSAGPAPTGDEGGRSSFMIVLRYDAIYEGPDRNYTLDLSNSLTFEQGMR